MAAKLKGSRKQIQTKEKDNVQDNSDKRRTRDASIRREPPAGERARDGTNSRDGHFPWQGPQDVGPRHDLQRVRWTAAAAADELQDVQWAGCARGVDRGKRRGRRREFSQEQHREARTRPDKGK